MEPSPQIDGTVPLRLLRDVVLLSRHFHTIIDPRVKKALGLTSNEVYVLRSLTLGFDRPSDIGRRLRLAAPSVSRAVDRLVANGYVERQPSAVDARATVLRLTPAGEEVIERAYTLAAEILDEHHGDLDPAVVERAADAVQALLTGIRGEGRPTA